jgi:hypothetical protein
MVWKPFKAVRTWPNSLGDDRVEIASALMLGARFIQQVSTQWSCIDDCPESNDPIHTGWWHHKVNAARAYLTIKGLEYDGEGNPLPGSPVATVQANGRDIDG